MLWCWWRKNENETKQKQKHQQQRTIKRMTLLLGVWFWAYLSVSVSQESVNQSSPTHSMPIPSSLTNANANANTNTVTATATATPAPRPSRHWPDSHYLLVVDTDTSVYGNDRYRHSIDTCQSIYWVFPPKRRRFLSRSMKYVGRQIAKILILKNTKNGHGHGIWINMSQNLYTKYLVVDLNIHIVVLARNTITLGGMYGRPCNY